ncbi:type II secretion system F family protein [Flavobacterium rhizosphaerae]|uniref:General secretion pathway protein F n=1 Tax=Flavobacterium rhizosphaerae TaxID=3163298 RepID=A0ABW8YTN0_9FLAO
MSIDLSTYKNTVGSKKAQSFNLQLNFGKGFSDKQKEHFYRELGLLLQSGVDFRKSLEIMVRQAKKKSEKDVLTQIKDKVIQGKGIYESMKLSGHFSSYEYYSVQIGEETGLLESVLEELHKFFENKIQMRRQVISVMTYPCIVLLVTFLVLYFMLVKVVPMFSSVFKQFGSELPKSTQVIIMLSNNSGVFFSIFIFVIIAAVASHQLMKNKDSYRSVFTSFLLKVPYFGSLIRKIYLSRFCQSMNLLTASKTNLITSLSLTAKMIAFYPVEKSLQGVIRDITYGELLSDSLKKHSIYEDRLVSMIEVAEQVNQLDKMFENLSDQYKNEISHQTKMIGVVLEPLIIIIIGIFVGTIMVAMYAPMFDLSKIMSR